MYRFRTIAQVKYGHFKDYWGASPKKAVNELFRERGWTEFHDVGQSRRWGSETR